MSGPDPAPSALSPTRAPRHLRSTRYMAPELFPPRIALPPPLILAPTASSSSTLPHPTPTHDMCTLPNVADGSGFSETHETHDAPCSPPSFSEPSTPRPSLEPVCVAGAPPKEFTVVLDLDETLLHAFFPDKLRAWQRDWLELQLETQERLHIPFERRSFHRVAMRDPPPAAALAALSDEGGPGTRTRTRLRHANVLQLQEELDESHVIVQVRPYLWSFLDDLFASYNVGVYSAGSANYVHRICRFLLTPRALSRAPACFLFELCYDHLQHEASPELARSLFYTKPLHAIVRQCPHLELDARRLLLVDNREENGFHYRRQLVHVRDFQEQPWETWAAHALTLLRRTTQSGAPLPSLEALVPLYASADNALHSAVPLDIGVMARQLRRALTLAGPEALAPAFAPFVPSAPRWADMSDTDDESECDSVAVRFVELPGECELLCKEPEPEVAATTTCLDLLTGSPPLPP